MEWFSALDVAKIKKSSENPTQVPSHIKDKEKDE
jgi:hypothetical protein